jgi:hypothetical protein
MFGLVFSIVVAVVAMWIVDIRVKRWWREEQDRKDAFEAEWRRIHDDPTAWHDKTGGK